MKAFSSSCLVVLLLASITLPQVQKTKLPIDAGIGCVDVTKKLDSQVTDGKMTVAQCCGGMKLIADVKEETVSGKKIKTIFAWHVMSSEARELKADMGEVVREQMKDGKDREKFRFLEKLIVVKEPKACFLVERKNAQ